MSLERRRCRESQPFPDVERANGERHMSLPAQAGHELPTQATARMRATRVATGQRGSNGRGTRPAFQMDSRFFFAWPHGVRCHLMSTTRFYSCKLCWTSKRKGILDIGNFPLSE